MAMLLYQQHNIVHLEFFIEISLPPFLILHNKFSSLSPPGTGSQPVGTGALSDPTLGVRVNISGQRTIFSMATSKDRLMTFERSPKVNSNKHTHSKL